eukprot:2797732-Lingulodinium_polyedra.AAC.1
MQKVAAGPEQSAQLLVALFSKFDFEVKETVDEEGRLTQSANSWAKQWEADLLSLAECEAGEDLLKEGDGDVLAPFGRCKQQFIALGVRILR